MPSSAPARADRGTLTREHILRAAVELLDQRGAAGLTMRGLAAALGTKPMTLYTHVRGKDDLIEGVIGLVFEEVPMPEIGSAPWQELFREVLGTYRRALLRHPGVVPFIQGRPVNPNGEWVRVVEHGLGMLRAAGFDSGTAVNALRALLSLTYGAVLNETVNRQRADASASLAPLAHVDAPEIAAAAADLESPDFDAFFDFALDALIAGLEIQLTRTTSSQP
jgi:AcrR family transcriptional regulator